MGMEWGERGGIGGSVGECFFGGINSIKRDATGFPGKGVWSLLILMLTKRLELCYHKGPQRRDGRVAEGARLESVFG